MKLLFDNKTQQNKYKHYSKRRACSMSKPKQIKVTFIGNSYAVKAKADDKKIKKDLQAKRDNAESCPFC